MTLTDEHTTEEVLFSFVIENACSKPASQRILVYRAAAERLSGVKYAEELYRLADQLEQIENSTEQLKLKFRKELM